MRTLLSLLIIIGLCGYYYHVKHEVKPINKSEITKTTITNSTQPNVTDLGCTEEVEFDTVVGLNKINLSGRKLLKQSKFLGKHYVKNIYFKKSVRILDLSDDVFDKKVYITKKNLVVSYNPMGTSNSETIFCDYNTGKCKTYEKVFVTDIKSVDELEVLLYEYDTTHPHDLTYMGDYEIAVFNLKTMKIK